MNTRMTKILLWEMIKMNIRECSFKYAKLKKKKQKKTKNERYKEVELEARITEIQKLVESQTCQTMKEKFNGRDPC